MKCPSCKGSLVMHHAGDKAGRGHCNACGICWAAEDIKPRRVEKVVTNGTDD